MAATGGTPIPTSTTAPPTNTPVATATSPAGGGACEVDYTIANSWSNGFTADVVITNNTSSAIAGWSLVWTLANGEQVTSAWNADISQSGSTVTASNVASHWNGTIGANGGTVAFGYQANHNGSTSVPTTFTLNGVTCNDGGTPPTATSVPPTATSAPPTATSAPPTATSVPPTATSAPPTATSVPPTATSIPPTATPGSGGSCSSDYNITNDWGNGFTANLTVTNLGAPINGWTIVITFGGNQNIVNLWNGNYSQSGNTVVITDSGWNANIPTNGSVTVGFQATYSGSNNIPTSITLNGELCS